MTEDRAMYDEEGSEVNMQGGGAQTKGAISQGSTKDGNINVSREGAPADREELRDDESPEEDEQQPSFAARVNITIEKKGVKGAVQVEAIAQDGVIVTENVYYFPKAELADAETAEADWARRGLYTGPPYGNLDEDLQVLIERYLEERGVNTALALWVPEYIDYKEQKEYLNWLSRECTRKTTCKTCTDFLAEMKKFVDA